MTTVKPIYIALHVIFSLLGHDHHLVAIVTILLHVQTARQPLAAVCFGLVFDATVGDSLVASCAVHCDGFKVAAVDVCLHRHDHVACRLV